MGLKAIRGVLGHEWFWHAQCAHATPMYQTDEVDQVDLPVYPQRNGYVALLGSQPISG